jgi:hypothetical protein
VAHLPQDRVRIKADLLKDQVQAADLLQDQAQRVVAVKWIDQAVAAAKPAANRALAV